MRASKSARAYGQRYALFVHSDHWFKLIESKRNFHYFVSSNTTTCADLQRYLNYRKLGSLACSSTNIYLSQKCGSRCHFLTVDHFNWWIFSTRLLRNTPQDEHLSLVANQSQNLLQTCLLKTMLYKFTTYYFLLPCFVKRPAYQ